MRRALKLVSSFGSAALILSGAAVAAPPGGLTYDQWGVSGGTITPTTGTSANGFCPTGFACGAAVTGDGFFQRQLTDSAGNRYFQTMITNTGATGTPTGTTPLDFADENYVKIATPGAAVATGLADKQSLNDVPGQFKTAALINVGWAQLPGEVNVQISQTVAESASGFSNSFTFAQLDPRAISRTIDMDQNVVLQAATAPAVSDTQRFVLRERSGTAVTTAGTFTLPGTPTPSLAFAAGDDVKVIWVGQNMPSLGNLFGFQSYSNLSAPTTVTPNPITYFDNAQTGPWNWNTTVFGTAPTF